MGIAGSVKFLPIVVITVKQNTTASMDDHSSSSSASELKRSAFVGISKILKQNQQWKPEVSELVERRENKTL